MSDPRWREKNWRITFYEEGKEPMVVEPYGKAVEDMLDGLVTVFILELRDADKIVIEATDPDKNDEAKQ